MPFEGININKYLPNADLGRFIARTQMVGDASPEARRGGLAELTMIEDREERERKRKFEEEQKREEFKQKFRQDRFAESIKQYKESSSADERRKLRANMVLQMLNLGIRDPDEMDLVLNEVAATPLQKTPIQKQIEEKATGKLVEKADFASLQKAAVTGDISALKPPEKSFAEDLPSALVTAMAKDYTSGSFLRAIKANDPSLLEEAAETREVENIGGVLVDVTRYKETGNADDVLILGDFSKPRKTSLQVAEDAVAGLEKKLKENPGDAKTRSALARAIEFRDDAVKKRSAPEDKELGNRLDEARSVIEDIREMIAEPADEEGEPTGESNDPGSLGGYGGSVAGITGSLKSTFGGAARQIFKLPISTKSKLLKIKLKTLSSKMAPILTGEKRVSDTERAAVEEITSGLGGFLGVTIPDEADITTSINNLYDEINRIEGRIIGKGSDEQELTSIENRIADGTATPDEVRRWNEANP